MNPKGDPLTTFVIEKHQQGVHSAAQKHQQGVHSAAQKHQQGVHSAAQKHQQGVHSAAQKHQQGVHSAAQQLIICVCHSFKDAGECCATTLQYTSL